MFKNLKNWQSFVIIAIVSFLSLLIIQQAAIASWQDPIEQPGSGSAATGFVLNPVTEDIDLQGSYITDSTLGEPGNPKKGVISAAGCPSLCVNGAAVIYAETYNSSGYAFKGVHTQGGAAAYFDGKVGIGQASNPTHLLDIVSRDGGDNAEINIQSGLNDYWGIYDVDSADGTDNELRFWNDNVAGDSNALVLDNSGNVEINNGYLQIDTTMAVPPAGDCTEDTLGRMIVHTGTNRLYICSGNLLGGINWRYTALSL